MNVHWFHKDHMYIFVLRFAMCKCKDKLLLTGRINDRNNQDGFQMMISAAVMESNRDWGCSAPC